MNLKKTLSKLLDSHEFLSTEAESTSSETDDNKNNTETVYNLTNLKNWLKNLHISLSETLKIPSSSSYLLQIDSSDMNSLPSLLINCHLSFVERECTEEPYKVTKRLLNLWDYCELHSI
jgi:hypothetical protein